MTKIYIKLPSLDDTELIPTIKDAVNKADKPKNLVFGIYLLYKEEENLNNLVQVTENLKQSHGSEFKLMAQEFTEELIGVGVGRKMAESMYEDEDYVLQIDAHTMFCKNWDATMKVLVELQPKKTILTAMPAPYCYIDGVRSPMKTLHGTGRLLQLSPANSTYRKNAYEKPIDWVPQWTGTISTSTDEFVPVKMFCSKFGFGRKDWGEYSGVPENAIKHSEESLQTLNLHKKGFKFMFPNTKHFLIGHLYKENINQYGKRHSLIDYVGPEKANNLIYIQDKAYYEGEISKKYKKTLKSM
tara:strand:- start:851 stop:1747 length:897 start_codon:yes stop_codon:yes gene_type:complete